jgi:hypothetical protein
MTTDEFEKIIGDRVATARRSKTGKLDTGMVDQPMLEWARQGAGVRFALIVHHTDAEREWAYDRISSVGKLDKALDVAQAEGWTVVDMKNDWNAYSHSKENETLNGLRTAADP